jgi:hypothetical protein
MVEPKPKFVVRVGKIIFGMEIFAIFMFESLVIRIINVKRLL